MKRLRPGAIDQDGFRVPGRTARKAVPRGTSTVDLSSLGGALAAPIDRYVGNTGQGMTKELVKEALLMCAAGLPGGAALEVLEVTQINSHLQHARTRAWKVTVPYKCREIMDKQELYPDGWSHRAYFAPRQERSKRARAGEGLRVEEALLQGEERANVARQQQQEDRVEQEVTARVEASEATALAPQA